MLDFGQRELEAIGQVALSGKLFRYTDQSRCGLFERRYAEYLGARHVTMTASGSFALLAAITALGIGPGDEVIVPTHTYMATATSVLAAGAIPVLCDVDASLTMCPTALEAAIGPRTRAVIPVHMWGHPCDMDRIMAIARARKLLVIEDACQGVGGSYRGRKLGSMGDAGAFSFNYFKNMTCGEGGAAVTSDSVVAQTISCAVDCCGFYWKGQESDFKPFAANSARASEFEGAAMNVQLDRIDGLLATARNAKRQMIQAMPSGRGIRSVEAHCPQGECGTHLLVQATSASEAARLAQAVGCSLASNTGRHTFTFWEPVLQKRGAFHPRMNPYNLAENAQCRADYSEQRFCRSLDLLNRTLLVGVPAGADAQAKIEQFAKVVSTV